VVRQSRPSPTPAATRPPHLALPCDGCRDLGAEAGKLGEGGGVRQGDLLLDRRLGEPALPHGARRLGSTARARLGLRLALAGREGSADGRLVHSDRDGRRLVLGRRLVAVAVAAEAARQPPSEGRRACGPSGKGAPYTLEGAGEPRQLPVLLGRAARDLGVAQRALGILLAGRLDGLGEAGAAKGVVAGQALGPPVRAQHLEADAAAQTLRDGVQQRVGAVRMHGEHPFRRETQQDFFELSLRCTYLVGPPRA